MANVCVEVCRKIQILRLGDAKLGGDRATIVGATVGIEKSGTGVVSAASAFGTNCNDRLTHTCKAGEIYRVAVGVGANRLETFAQKLTTFVAIIIVGINIFPTFFIQIIGNKDF